MQKAKSAEDPFSRVAIEMTSPLWARDFSQTHRTLFTALEAGLQKFPLYREKIELSIVLADNAFIQDLNKQYRHKNHPTNVLSFPMEDLRKGTFFPPIPLLLLGDMIFAFETILQEAEAKKISFQDYMFHLCIHSFLHLLGYDHMAEKDAEEMEFLEIEILRQVDIKNPYRIDEN